MTDCMAGNCWDCRMGTAASRLIYLGSKYVFAFIWNWNPNFFYEDYFFFF